MLPRIDVNKEVDRIDEEISNSIFESEIDPVDLSSRMMSLHIDLNLNPPDHIFYGRSR